MDSQNLKDYFKFDETDLEANRKGEYSEVQKKRLFSGLFAPKKYFFYEAQGPIWIEAYRTDPRSPANHHSLHVGKKEFDVKQELVSIMEKGDVYAVYYCNAAESGDDSELNSWDKILSVKFISKGTAGSEQGEASGMSQKRLQELQNLRGANLITELEFEQKKKEILDQL